MTRALALVVLAATTARADAPKLAAPTVVALPGGADGIGFDDLVYAPALDRVLAPAGRTGALVLVDPADPVHHQDAIAGFGSPRDAAFAGGHGEGTTSADAGPDAIFASDRDRGEVVAIPLAGKPRAIARRAHLAASPDYVRYVAPTREVWVTEPRAKQIEIFTYTKNAFARVGAIAIPGGPESLAIDPARGRAYTHTWDDVTVVIDLAKRAEIARWPNGCKASRGIALDVARALLFVGCDEGKATALDVAHGGARVGEVATGKGVDIIAYAPALGHLYVPGGDDATLTVVGVGRDGHLTALGTVATAADAHCAAADDRGHVLVCAPKRGALLAIADPFPASR